MANLYPYYTDLAATQVAPANVLGSLNAPELEMGHLYQVTATYTLKGNEVANDLIRIINLPKGAMVDISGSSVTTNGGGVALSITVGDDDTSVTTADASRYSSTISLTSAVTTVPTAFTAGTVLNAPASLGQDSWVLAKVTVANTPTAGNVLVFRLRVITPN